MEALLDDRMVELDRHGRLFGILHIGVDGHALMADRRGIEIDEALLRNVGNILLGLIRK